MEDADLERRAAEVRKALKDAEKAGEKGEPFTNLDFFTKQRELEDLRLSSQRPPERPSKFDRPSGEAQQPEPESKRPAVATEDKEGQ